MARKVKRGVKRERILRVLANHPSGEMSRRRVSKEADCSQAWTHIYIEHLESMGLVKGMKIVSFLEFLDYWRSVSVPQVRRKYVIKEGVDILKGIEMRYALTTYVGENLLQGHLFPSRIDVRIDERNEKEWHMFLSHRGLVGGGNFQTISSDSHVFYGTMKRKGFDIVSPPQLVIDLFEEGGPSLEAAMMIMEKLGGNVL